MTLRSHPQRPVGLTVIGVAMIASSVGAVVVAVLWIVFASQISSAAADLLRGPDSLGLVAAPLAYPVVAGSVAIGFGLVQTVAAIAMMRGRKSGLLLTRIVLWALVIGIVAWGTIFGSWLVTQANQDPDAPPFVAALLIAAFPTLIAVGVVGSVLWYLSRPEVTKYCST